MKSKHEPLGQFLFENHDYDGSFDDFLEETAPLIGYIVHTFNSLDEQLNSSICELINEHSDHPGAIVIYKMNFSSKVDLFYRLGIFMEIGCEGTMPSFKSLIDDLKKCGTLRNAVIHAE